MKDRMPLYFFLAAVLNLAFLGIAIRQATHPGWKSYQREYLRLEARQEPNAAAKTAVLRTPAMINQVLLPGLKRVDRCTTCHLGIEDPTMKRAAVPFSYHANVRTHPPARFGCTICHGGQGLATTVRAAHGHVEHWEQPLLPKEYIRASCGQCHTKGDIPGVPELSAGRKLFDSHGCRGCHKLDGVGGSIGPDLSREGSTRRDPKWLESHFLDPQSVSPNSAMPNFHFTKEQAKDLTFYMLSLTGEQLGSYYTSKELIPSVAYGRRLFREKNCITCHTIGGIGGRGGPDLLGVLKRHSPAWLNEQLANPGQVSPKSTMPAYDLDNNERAALIRFMGSATPADAGALIAGRQAALSPEASAVEAGRMAFQRYGCVGCHGEGAKGGVPNPNSQGGEVPSLIHVAEDYRKDEVVAIIRNGKIPPTADSHKPAPPLYMPAWKDTVNSEDIHNIVEYLWSLEPKEDLGW